MGRLPVAMPKAIGAADRVLRSGSPVKVRRQACDLLLVLAAVESWIRDGGAAQVPEPLFRDLVITTARLVGRTRPEAGAGSTARFAALHATRRPPPPLPELDHIVAGVLAERFGLAPPALELAC